MATAMRKSVSADGSASSRVSSRDGVVRSYGIDTPFSLVPAIFLPYPAPSPTAHLSTAPLSPTQKLTTILANLDTQHETVRKNMLALVLQRADRLRDAAAAKVRRERRARVRSAVREAGGAEGEAGGGGREGSGDRSRAKRREEEEMRRALGDLAARLKTPGPGPGHGHAMKGSEYELKKDETFAMQVRTQTRGNNSSATAINGARALQNTAVDVEMGMDNDQATIEREIETEADILRELNRDLQELVDHAVGEMVGYAEHAAMVKGEYQRALEKRGGGGGATGGLGRRGSEVGSAATPDGAGIVAGAGAGVGAGAGSGSGVVAVPAAAAAAGRGGILKKKTQAKSVERNAIRRRVSWNV